jgi:hypothetical protein
VARTEKTAALRQNENLAEHNSALREENGELDTLRSELSMAHTETTAALMQNAELAEHSTAALMHNADLAEYSSALREENSALREEVAQLLAECEVMRDIAEKLRGELDSSTSHALVHVSFRRRIMCVQTCMPIQVKRGCNAKSVS